MGSAMARKVIGSVLGVRTALMKAMPTTMPRHMPPIRFALSAPTRLRKTSTTGNRKAMPKASRVSVTKLR
jgi:hypothetical protein